MIRIAIDGPGGAGKSSVAKAVAKELGIIYVDTGALYRTIGVYAKSCNVNTSSEDELSTLLPNINLELKFENGRQVILLNGNEVGDEIRTPEASMAASAVSALPVVREFLLMTQRSIAEKNSVIMDGRDIGTVILPNAEVKIFLTASPEARAKRRFDELTAKGIETTYKQVYDEMVERDKNDSTRAIAPCVPADDAILLDNSNFTAEGTVKEVIKIIERAKKKRNKRGSAFYLTTRVFVKLFFKLFYRIKVYGKENLPACGGAVLCSNHIGISDVFLLAITAPRQLFFLSKKEWFSVPVLRTVMKWLGAIELDRGGKDVGALKSAVKTLKSGKIVALFPQGHRYPAISPANTPIKSGAALIAYHSGTDVIPVCIKTKNVKYKLFGKIEIIIGKPLSKDDLGFKKGGYDEYKQASEIVFNEICMLGGYGEYRSRNDSEA